MATNYVSKRQTIGRVRPQTKSDVLKLNDNEFKKMDEHARQAPRSVEKSIETLANYLAKPANSELEVVRGLYVWVCENISYDVKAYLSGTVSSLDTSGDGVLKSKSSVCAGYANLFLSLCKAIGITCKKISGYAKDKGDGDIFTHNMNTNHAWNIVQLNGVWRFIETTWGSGYLSPNQKLVKEFNSFYFLTPPDQFIYDHFPFMNNDVYESKQLQLLENPISIEEYSRIILPSKEALKYGVKFLSHPYATIAVNRSCTIIVETTDNIFQDCWYEFNDDTGTKCYAGAMMVCENNKKCRTTVRPPQKGKYTLKLVAQIKDENTRLVEYAIECEAAEPNWKPYPNDKYYYGPEPDFTERGFQRFSVRPLYECKDGRFHLSFKTILTPDLLVHLHDAENVDHKDYMMVEQTNSTIDIRTRLLKKGYYNLYIYSKKGQNYSNAYRVLVQNTTESNVKSKFPITYSTTTTKQCRLVQPLVRELPAKSEVCIEFISSAFDSILVDQKKFPCDNGDIWKVRVTTGETGELCVAGNTSEGSYERIYTFLIES